ncbi:hypothetical protein ACHAXA_004607 [Cyclostephanos tholiformis]|uniref:Membrane-associated protein n=1 Tax=Cyclostephanos tholiformis TaxID=382380 RepID=A0ABD3SNZ5_9STRA
MSERRPTETDRLLSPLAVSSHNVQRDGANPGGRCRRWPVTFVIGGAAVVLLASVVALGVVTSPPFAPSDGGGGRGVRHVDDDGDDSLSPATQLHELQLSTENALMSILPNDTLARIYSQGTSSSRHPAGKLHELTTGHHVDRFDGESRDGGVLRCTSQVMIMRHCDKEVELGVRGHKVTTDAHDSRGNRHCSSTGKARSEYIATLFVDPHDYQKLVGGGDRAGGPRKEDDVYVPPVPMVKSTLNRVSKVASSRKPQFPTPLKLYALSPERDNEGRGKFHENYREVETITPLSRKFRLDVDERFGVGDEGDLARDYFLELGNSVTEKYRWRMIRMNGSNGKERKGDYDDYDDDHGDEGRSEFGGEALCDRGMTVVNWKHSRIPELARALGCGIRQGCPEKYNSKDFDTMWLITFQYTLILSGMGASASSSLGREKGMIDDAHVSPISSLLASLQLKSLSSGDSMGRGGGESGNGRRNNNIGTWKIKAEMVNEGFYPV